MPERIIEVRFGVDTGDYLALTVRGRAYRHKTDFWDGNWLLVTATIHVGKFSGEIPGMLRADELETFAQALQTFHQSSTETVSFKTAEEWLHFHLEIDKLGRTEIIGSISDEVTHPYNSLKFSFTVPQGFLAAPLRQLQTVMQAFPVIGKPE